MELAPIYKRVIGLEVHQAQINACAITEQSDGKVGSGMSKPASRGN